MKTYIHSLETFEEKLTLQKYSPKTIKSYTHHIETFIKWLDSEDIMDVRSVTKRHIAVYLEELKKKHATNTVHIKIRSLKRFYEHLQKNRNILENPITNIKLPSVKGYLPKGILSKEEIKTLLLAPDPHKSSGLRDRAILELMYSSGIRREECATLKITDVDARGGYLRINLGKGSKDRVVPIGKVACHYLHEYPLRVRPLWVRKGKSSDALFLTKQYGTPLGGSSIRNIVKKHAKKAGIEKPVSAHTMRRTCATHLLLGGAHLLYVQRLLGHSHTDTLSRYVKIACTELKEAHRKHHPREKRK